MLLSKNARWRKFVIPFVLVMGINFGYIPVTQAGVCSWWDALSLGKTCVDNLLAYRLGESQGKGFVRGVKPEFKKMVDEAGKQLADHVTNSVNWNKIGQKLGQGASDVVLKALQSINWEEHGQKIGAGLRKEFEATMDKLFDEKIRPLLKDIDMVLENRLEQADKIAEARLNQLDSIIEDKVKKIDALIQGTFDQFRVTVNDTIKKVRNDLIDYAFTQATEWRDESIEKVRTDVIDYATHAFAKTTDDAIAKIRSELIEHTFNKLEKLRQDFSADMVNFFKGARELIVRLECAEEKTRLDIETAVRQLDKLGDKYVKEVKNLNPKNLLTWGKSTTPPTSSKTSTVEDCYKKAGVDLNNIESVEGFEYLTKYKIKKCKVLSTLHSNTPVERIASVYWDLYKFAQRIACFQENTEDFAWDLLEFKDEYQFWNAMKYY
ncbi:hypothetical protein [Candidatus Parabeggiatoa sp. HSG14]|uniref:hypothetical protein n=1 Tax=Candidatus Parabeggiatoa sp. HSG14 TaxID=3055593 RepID=UPI0025A8F806|nr:hypothetical protein [Thiotrichales bacterium HSG14]